MDWEFRNDLPIYSQLMDKLCAMIVSGFYQPGQKLPSVRDLAVQAAVNPNTVQRAFAELEREELIFSQRTTGRYVTEDCAMIERIKHRMAQQRTLQYLQDMKKIGCTQEQIVSLVQQTEEET